jgi:dynamin family protein
MAHLQEEAFTANWTINGDGGPAANGNEESDELTRFEHLRHKLVDLHEPFVEIGRELNDAALAGRVERSAALIASGTFNVAVFGGFSSGKTTLLNALVPGVHLPTAATPTTAVPTLISHSPHPRLRIIYRSQEELEHLNRLLPPEEQLDLPFEKAGYVLELPRIDAMAEFLRDGQDAPFIRQAEVSLPNVALARGVRLIDLPGTNSTLPLHRITAETYIPQVDVILFVINGQCAMGATEDEILRAMQRAGKAQGFDRFLFFVNKMDMVRDHDAVLDHVLEGLRDRHGFEAPNVLSGCARLAELATQAARTADQEKEAGRIVRWFAEPGASSETWERLSGVAGLRSALEEVIVRSRGNLVLKSGVERLWSAYLDASLQVDPLLREDRASYAEIVDRIETMRQQIRDIDFPTAHELLRDALQDARQQLAEELATADSLQQQLLARWQSAGTFANQHAFNAQVRADQDRWLEDRRVNCGRIVEDLERRQRGIADRVYRTVTGRLAALRGETGAQQRPLFDDSAADLHLYDDSQLSITVGIGAAVAGGAATGVVFANVIGAAVGGVLAGAAAWIATRFWGAAANTTKIETHIGQLRSRLDEQLTDQLERTRDLYSEGIGRLERETMAKADALQATFTGTAEELDARVQHFQQIRDRLDAALEAVDGYCEKLGFETWEAVQQRRTALVRTPAAEPMEEPVF